MCEKSVVDSLKDALTGATRGEVTFVDDGNVADAS
jgi:hypothetical protein